MFSKIIKLYLLLILFLTIAVFGEPNISPVNLEALKPPITLINLPSAGISNEIPVTSPTDTVYVHDVGTLAICLPSNPQPGDLIVPQAWVTDSGMVPETFYTMMRIETETSHVYLESTRVVNLMPDSNQLISFSVWDAGPPGQSVVTCSTMLWNDENRSNDKKVIHVPYVLVNLALSDHKDNLKEKEITVTPNPFNNQISFSYTKAYKGPTFLAIYNLEGRIIRTLVKKQEEAGRYKIYWDGKDSEFKDMPSGIYFIFWQSGEKATIKKIIRR